MASPAVDNATGITLVAGTSGWSAQVTDFGGPSISRESIDVTHQGTTNARIFNPADFYDGGDLSVSGHFNPDALPPINTVNETWTITWPGGATWAFSGHMSGFDPGAVLDQKMEFEATIKVSGEITPTAAP